MPEGLKLVPESNSNIYYYINQLYIMGENKNSSAIGILVFVVFLVIMLAAFNMANNLTAGTIFGTVLTGLFIGFLVAAAIMNS